ncbi:MAG TPA: DnaJ C-terminal domain-containing protein [Aliidongia sp.]|uniref:DnaJ C-terminal domain-containing protein n=1 Tax=Aliidongia sp. TaxID=1914230 RepID=UPI002DDDBA96|nr:DnaJ C-terminal domain-containing protein [Aliidongia sp.]HEV2677293.1 DnaJ C-terminal domain-containing protein [Aliidongia sp.]
MDPYATLQVGRDASPDEIKRSYRKLAKELHPDLHPNNPVSARRFNDITAAYDVLSDDAKRRQYDTKVAAAEAATRTGRGRSNPLDDDGLDSFFGRSWGFRREATGSGPKLRGADIYQSLTVPFVEAAIGAKKRLIIKDQRVLEVAIPAMTQDGQTLRLKGQGGAGTNGGPAGDVFVELTVEPHPLFTRRDHDILMTLPVTLPEAVLGATVTVPTVQGLVSLKVPKGSNTDQVLRLRGKGLGGQGDQLVTLKLVLPTAKDGELTDFLEEWSKRHSYSVRPKY